MKRKTNEYGPFNELAGKLLSVPHTQIKRKLDAEKAEKKRKAKKPSAFRVGV